MSVHLSPRHIRGIAMRAVAASALVLGAIGLAQAPASAASWPGYGNGTIGVQQTITGTYACPSTPVFFVATYANGVSDTNAASVTTDSSGRATILWTPSIVGQITQATISTNLIGSSCSTDYLGGANIGQTPTTTTVSAPNNAQVGVATKITVTVQSKSPSSYTPTGQVVVKDVNGATLATMGLTAGSGNGQSYAYYWWTPPSAGSFTFQATYSGDTNAATSVSPQGFSIATPSGTPISLTSPSTMTQNVPVTLTATVYPPSVQGTAAFTINGKPISGSIALVNGVANFTWTPNVVGAVVVGANYTANTGANGATSNPATIVTGPASNDVITVTPVGGSTWAPNGSYTLAASSTTNFTVSTLSGAGVTLNDSGPCTTPGLSVVTPADPGSCVLTFVSPGANGYAGVTQKYNVTVGLGQQTATVSPPLSGHINKGRTIILEAPGQGDTNAGQNINWRITAGKKVCSLGFPANLSVTLKMKKKGSCTVVGSAPGIPNQWAPYSITRTYRA